MKLRAPLMAALLLCSTVSAFAQADPADPHHPSEAADPQQEQSPAAPVPGSEQAQANAPARAGAEMSVLDQAPMDGSQPAGMGMMNMMDMMQMMMGGSGEMPSAPGMLPDAPNAMHAMQMMQSMQMMQAIQMSMMNMMQGMQMSMMETMQMMMGGPTPMEGGQMPGGPMAAAPGMGQGAAMGGPADLGPPDRMGGAMLEGAMPPANEGYMDAMDAMQGPMMDAMQMADPDVAFVLGMIAHHQAAIDMSTTLIQFGDDERVREWAEAIIAAQQDEIDEMRAWLAERGL